MPTPAAHHVPRSTGARLKAVPFCWVMTMAFARPVTGSVLATWASGRETTLTDTYPTLPSRAEAFDPASGGFERHRLYQESFGSGIRATAC